MGEQHEPYGHRVRYWPTYWDELREWVMRRDRYRCQAREEWPHECLAALEVHHVEPKGMGGTSRERAERINHPDNLISVCPVAHRLIHANPAKAKALGLLRPIRHGG